MLDQHFFQYTARLNKQTAIDGFVGHVQRLVIGKRPFQPTSYLLRRPIETQFPGHYTLQAAVLSKLTTLRPLESYSMLDLKMLSNVSA